MTFKTPKEILQELIPLQPNEIKVLLLRVLPFLTDDLGLKEADKITDALELFEGQQKDFMRQLFDECMNLVPKMVKKAS